MLVKSLLSEIKQHMSVVVLLVDLSAYLKHCFSIGHLQSVDVSWQDHGNVPFELRLACLCSLHDGSLSPVPPSDRNSAHERRSIDAHCTVLYSAVSLLYIDVKWMTISCAFLVFGGLYSIMLAFVDIPDFSCVGV